MRPTERFHSVYILMHETRLAHTCVSAGSFLYFYFISWDRISYYWCLQLWRDWLSSKHPQIHLSGLLCWYRHYKDTHSYLDVLKIQTWVECLYSEHFIHWSTSLLCKCIFYYIEFPVICYTYIICFYFVLYFKDSQFQFTF